jgi:peptidyl-prolyl cis-trans isomerase C
VLAALFAMGCHDKKEQVEKPVQPAPKPEAKPEAKPGLTPEESARVVARLGTRTITLGHVAKKLGGESPYVNARYNSSPEKRREYLDRMVSFELMAGEAEKRGYDKRSSIDGVRKRAIVEQMMQDVFERQGVKLSDVSDAEIKKYYDDHKDEFETSAQMRASQILVKDSVTAHKILAELKQSSGDMNVFRKLATQYNEDPQTKDTFGDLLFFPEIRSAGEAPGPDRPDAVRKAVFSLKKEGDIYAEPVHSEKGFHVLELTGKREATKRALADARGVIQNQLWHAKRDAAIEKFTADLRSKADVQESTELLSKLHVEPATVKKR